MSSGNMAVASSGFEAGSAVIHQGNAKAQAAGADVNRFDGQS
jgi:hypothetical protein